MIWFTLMTLTGFVGLVCIRPNDLQYPNRSPGAMFFGLVCVMVLMLGLIGMIVNMVVV